MSTRTPTKSQLEFRLNIDYATSAKLSGKPLEVNHGIHGKHGGGGAADWIIFVGGLETRHLAASAGQMRCECMSSTTVIHSPLLTRLEAASPTHQQK